LATPSPASSRRLIPFSCLALQAIDGTPTVHSGTFTIRYGLRFLGKPHLSIVPGLVALDYGDMLVGAEAWEFITRRSNLHPRAESFALSQRRS